MKTRMTAGGVALALAIAGLVVYTTWALWPSEARRIRRQLDALAAVINERPSDGITQMTRAARLTRFFTDDVVLEPGHRAGPIRGRERLLALASRAPADANSYSVEFVDIDVDITGERSAVARFTAALSSRDPETGETEVDAREVEVQFQRTDDWRIARIALIDTLERPVP